MDKTAVRLEWNKAYNLACVLSGVVETNHQATVAALRNSLIELGNKIEALNSATTSTLPVVMPTLEEIQNRMGINRVFPEVRKTMNIDGNILPGMSVEEKIEQILYRTTQLNEAELNHENRIKNLENPPQEINRG